MYKNWVYILLSNCLIYFASDMVKKDDQRVAIIKCGLMNLTPNKDSDALYFTNQCLNMGLQSGTQIAKKDIETLNSSHDWLPLSNCSRNQATIS